MITSHFLLSLSAAIFSKYSADSLIRFLSLAFLDCQDALLSLSSLTSPSTPYLLITSIFSTGTYNMSQPSYKILKQSCLVVDNATVSNPSNLPIPWSICTTISPETKLFTS